MSKHPYIHIINEKISQSNKLHPFNDKKITKLTDKTRYIECFTKDISNGIVTYLLGDDDYCFKDISKKGKKNLFNFHLPNGQDYNIFVDHPDGGGKDISFNDSSKKVLIPYDNVSFRLLIKEMKNVLVLNIYYMLIKNESNELLPDFSKYVYLVVIPSEIYTSEVVYNILYDVKKSNGSSR
jgi:hypothetical protein